MLTQLLARVAFWRDVAQQSIDHAGQCVYKGLRFGALDQYQRKVVAKLRQLR